MPTWDPTAYATFAAERDRPFHDLLARVPVEHPVDVVDLGCGDGRLTALLAERWPDASVRGVDSSPTMLAAARKALPDRVRVEEGDVAAWMPSARTSLVVANAVLQWVPGHLDLMRRWSQALPPGAVLAVQVPANADAPSHALMREVAARAPFSDVLDGVLRAEPVHELASYLEVLEDGGAEGDAWETTYHHVLDRDGAHGPDAVLAWVRGTGLRPVLDALADAPDLLERYLEEYGAALRGAYPRRAWGTVLPFRRRFVVARRR